MKVNDIEPRLPMMKVSRPVMLLRHLAAASVLLVALITLRPSSSLIHHVSHPYLWFAEHGADAVALEISRVALWAVSAWIGLGLIATSASGTPGLRGRVARAVVRRCLPEIGRRMIASTLGTGLVLAPIAPAGAGAVTTGGSPVSARPALHQTLNDHARNRVAFAPDVGWPGSRVDPAPDVPWPTTPSTPAPPDPPSTADTDRHVTVRPEDSLWLIAARRLGPSASPAQIAAAWPGWYHANADVIGPDPNLIRPGQILIDPDSKGRVG
jgi:hypothetical protein